jgi:hypothetical protein
MKSTSKSRTTCSVRNREENDESEVPVRDETNNNLPTVLATFYDFICQQVLQSFVTRVFRMRLFPKETLYTLAKLFFMRVEL